MGLGQSARDRMKKVKYLPTSSFILVCLQKTQDVCFRKQSDWNLHTHVRILCEEVRNSLMVFYSRTFNHFSLDQSGVGSTVK